MGGYEAGVALATEKAVKKLVVPGCCDSCSTKDAGTYLILLDLLTGNGVEIATPDKSGSQYEAGHILVFMRPLLYQTSVWSVL